jgi:hypothetical protein
MTPVTFTFQFRDPFVEGIQFDFQFLDFMLNWKSPSRIFIYGWSFLRARALQASSPLCRHGPSESRAGGYANLACFSPEVALCCGAWFALPGVASLFRRQCSPEPTR